MEKPVPDVLYETRRHTTRRFCSNYLPQLNDEGTKGGLFSLLSVPGVNQLKEKWNEYKRPRKPKKWISLFVSATGEHVAVADGNRIIFLHKSDVMNQPTLPKARAVQEGKVHNKDRNIAPRFQSRRPRRPTLSTLAR